MENHYDLIGNRTHTFRLVAQCLNQLRHGVCPLQSIEECRKHLNSRALQDLFITYHLLLG